jgi:moderate conductance mechanosensitive channel
VPRPLAELFTSNHRFERPLVTALAIALLFFAAWAVSRAATRIAAFCVDRADRRHRRDSEMDTGAITSLRQRETGIALLRTSISYLAFLIAFVLSLVVLAGGQRLPTVIGASFLAIVLAFAAQRLLTDIIAGLMMFFEGWFRIGDTVAIDAWQVQGVVEGMSLRSLTIRAITGERMHISNSQVVALRVMPRGYRDVEIEFFTTQLEGSRALVEQLARIVPVGPTRFVHRPELVEIEALTDDLYRTEMRCAVAVGREWLAQDLLPTLIKERAPAGLLVHGPIVTFTDKQALRSFAHRMNG